MNPFSMILSYINPCPCVRKLYQLEEDYVCDLSKYNLSKYTNNAYANSPSNGLLAELKKSPGDIELYDVTDPTRTTILKITKNARLTVLKGYTWDGNSPKFSVLDLFCLGTPDGRIYEGKPMTYYVSLVHDALGHCRSNPDMPLAFRKSEKKHDDGRKGRDGLYFEMLKEINFPCRRIYYLGLLVFGPVYDWLTNSSWFAHKKESSPQLASQREIDVIRGFQ